MLAADDSLVLQLFNEPKIVIPCEYILVGKIKKRIDYFPRLDFIYSTVNAFRTERKHNERLKNADSFPPSHSS